MVSERGVTFLNVRSAVSAKELEIEGVGGLIPGEEIDVAAGIGFCGDNGLVGGWCVGGAIGAR